MINANTMRGAIRQLINRESVYTLRDYVRKVSKRIKRTVTMGEVKTSLRHMEYEGQLVAFIDSDNNNRVVGRLFKVA